jgi:hypothetical protein
MSLINEQNFAKRLPLPSRSHIRITPKPFHYLIAKNQPKIAWLRKLKISRRVGRGRGTP